jgi:hypothetical protein
MPGGSDRAHRGFHGDEARPPGRRVTGVSTFLSVMGDVNLVAFCLLALACAVQCRRHCHCSVRWATAAFTSLAVLGVIGEALERGAWQDLWVWWVKAILVILCLFPYLIYRFSVAFEGPHRTLHALATGATLLVAVATIALPELPVPVPGLDDPPWWSEYRVLIVGQWTLLFTIVVIRLWSASRTETSIPRLRLRTLALAAGGLNAAIFMSGVGPAPDTDAVKALVAVLLLSSSVLFFVGLSPPRWLVEVWRQPEQVAIQGAMHELFLAESQPQVCAALLPHAALVGARGAALVALDGTLLGTYGVTENEARTVALAAMDEAELPERLHRLQLQAGTLLLWRSAYAPVLGQNGLDLMEALRHFADIVMDRCALVERQRVTKQELAHQATHDHLTGLPNRVLLYDRLTQALARAGRGSGGATSSGARWTWRRSPGGCATRATWSLRRSPPPWSAVRPAGAASSSSTTTDACARCTPSSSRTTPTTSWWPQPRTGARRSPWPGTTSRTSCSSTWPCRAWAASRPCRSSGPWPPRRTSSWCPASSRPTSSPRRSRAERVPSSARSWGRTAS